MKDYGIPGYFLMIIGITLLGFRSLTSLKVKHNINPCKFIVPNDDVIIVI
jgi:hypothetical protein